MESSSRLGVTSRGSSISKYEEEVSEGRITACNGEQRRYSVVCPKMMNRYCFCWTAESSRKRIRYHLENLLPVVLSILLLARLPHALPSVRQAEAKDTATTRPEQRATPTNAEMTAQHEPAGLLPAKISGASPIATTSSKAVAKSETTTALATGSNPQHETASTRPTAEEAIVNTSSVPVDQQADHPAAVSEQREESGTPEIEAMPASLSPAASAFSRKQRVADKARRRQKRDGRPQGEETCGHGGRCFFLADSAFVNSAHLLPPPPPFTPPPTPDGRAFRHAVELCRVSPFNLDVGKKFIYLMSSAVTYYQQSRVKCAIAYAHIFREEDIPVASEDVLDACAVALLRHSPDDCWTDTADSRTVFLQGMPGTKLIEPPPEMTNSNGEPLDEAADARRRQFKRAERLTLTLFKFSLVSRCHLCPPYQRPRPSSKDLPNAGLLPKYGFQGPKHQAWRKCLTTLNKEVTRDLIGLPAPSESEDSATDNTVEMGTLSSNTHTVPTPTPEQDAAERGHHRSAGSNLIPPRKRSGELPVGGSWMLRGRASLPEGEEHGGQAGVSTGLGNIPAGAVFGGITNPISRYAALLSYLQSRYRFQRLKYEIDGNEPPPLNRGDGRSAAEPQGRSGNRPGTTQTLTLQAMDEDDVFAEEAAEAQGIADGRQFFTLEPARVRAKIRRARKQRSSCDLMPQDQAAEAAKAALACGANCVDTGEDLNTILRDGTQAPPANSTDSFWSQNDGSVWPVRLPRQPTAESLQRAYLNQLVSGCATSRVHLSEAEQFYFAQAATLHFFSRFYNKCLQAMDEMTLPLFMRAFSDDSRGGRGGMAALQEFLPIPAPYSGADQLMVNCAAAALVAGAMPRTSLSNAAASAEAIAGAAAAAGAPTWGAPTMKTRAALAASAYAYHQPGRGLTGRSKFTRRIPCWELDCKRVPLNMSKAEFRAVVTSFADLEIRPVPPADRRFLDEQLVPTVLRSLLKEKLPVRIFMGYKSPASRAFVLARYMRARFKLDHPEEAGWEKPPPLTLSVEDQTIKAAEVAVNCGPTCTDTGQSVGGLIRNGLEAYRRRRKKMKKVVNKGAEASKNDDTDEFGSEFDVQNATRMDDILKDTPPTTPRQKEPANALVRLFVPPVEDAAHAGLSVTISVLWISVTPSLAATFS